MSDFDPCGACGRVELHPPHRGPNHTGRGIITALALVGIVAGLAPMLLQLVFR